MSEETGFPAGAGTAAERRARGAAEGPPLPSLPVRLARVFTSPGELFDALARRPAWAGALVAVVAMAIVSVLLLPEEVLRTATERRSPPDASPEQIAGMVGTFRYVIAATVALTVPIMAALTAGLLLLIYNFLLGGQATYQQLFSVTAHALLIWGVGQLVGLGLVSAAGDPDATLSLHLLAPFAEPGAFLHRFLQSVEVFGLWTAAVLGIGVSRIYPGRAPGAAVAVVVGLYLALQAIGALVAGLAGA